MTPYPTPISSSGRGDPGAGTSHQTFRIAGPVELAQAVPYLLGFHPARSLVLVGLRDGQLVVTARCDLAELGDLEPEDLDHGGAASPPNVLVDTVTAMARGGTSELVAAVFTDPDDVFEPSRPRVVEAITSACRRHDVALLDAVVVMGGRVRSLVCDDARCCPPDGLALPRDPSEFVTAATVAGVVALPDRAALAATLDPAPDHERVALRPLIESAAERGPSVVRAHDVLEAVRRSQTVPATPLSDEDVAELVVALRDPGVRDSVWCAVDAGDLDARPLWRDLSRRAPVPYDAAPLFLYAWASWRAGDGALAAIAAERALARDPAYSAADLLLEALGHGIDPRRMPRLNPS